MAALNAHWDWLAEYREIKPILHAVNRQRYLLLDLSISGGLYFVSFRDAAGRTLNISNVGQGEAIQEIKAHHRVPWLP